MSYSLNSLNLLLLPLPKKNVQCEISGFSIIALCVVPFCCGSKVACISGMGQNHMLQIISSILPVTGSYVAAQSVSAPPLPSFVGRERWIASSNSGSDILPWYPTMKNITHFTEYNKNSSESKNENWREKNEHLSLPVLILPPEMRLVESS